MSRPIFLVCSTIRASNAEQASCSECGAAIWPTAGSFLRAEMQKIPMICVDCYAKIDEPTFGGFMHHGTMLPEGLGERLFVEFQQAMVRDKIDRRGGNESAT